MGENGLRIKTLLLTGLGYIFLGVGAIGLVLPVWPTTPFVLLSAACFSASPRVKERIMRIGFFREYIENYQNRAGLSKKTVVISLSYLWGMLLLSMLLVKTGWIIGLLCFVGIAVSIHILSVARSRAGKGAQPDEAGIRDL